MTNPTGPSHEQVVEALRTAGPDFGLAENGYDVVDEWERERSGNRFIRLRARSGGELLVKTGSSWVEDDARELFEAQKALAETVARADLDSAEAIQPLAWIARPPLFVMPFVEGTDLVSLLRRPERPEWAHMEKWMTAAGGMLAAFHRAQAVDPGTAVFAEIEETAARMRLDPAWVRNLLDRIEPADSTFVSYGDFGPGNLIGDERGRVFLIDPPTKPEPALFHRDLGNYVFELRRQLAGRGFSRSRPVPGRFYGLRQAFLAGYSSYLDSTDLTLVSLFEMRRAAGMARKRLPGRPGDALWFGRLALALRREVTGLVGQSE